MGLTKYKQKRKFTRTPEPEGKLNKVKTGLPLFVVQRHQASHLHFDFRIEHDGVLKSWAIPKEPSNDLDIKRLAVQVEDHPFAYAKFHGVIPEGQYGAGQVEIWDDGTYTYPGIKDRKLIREKIIKGFAKGHLKLELHGRKLKGLYSLIRYKTEEKNTWLFFKMHDDFAEEEQPELNVEKLDQVVRNIGILAPRTEFPHNIKPMLATLIDAPFSGREWIFELKLDGYRAIAELKNKEVKLLSRNQVNFTTRFQQVTDTLAKLPFDAVLDGELVILDEKGHSDFQLMQNYQKTGKGTLAYFIFDLLYFQGYDLRKLPLYSRKKILLQVMPKLHNVKVLDNIAGNGNAFFDVVSKEKLEGVIGKKRESIYQPGIRGKDWVKIKTGITIEAVIVGYTRPAGSRSYFGSLGVAIRKKNKWVYIGQVGTGFSELTLAKINSILKKIKTDKVILENAPKDKLLQFVKPQIKCNVHFSEWTGDKLMRHPKFVSLVKGLLVIKKSASTEKPRKYSQKENFVLEKTAKHEVKLTHLDKIYWPKYGYTKGNMIDYYKSVSEFLLPFLKDRPLTMHRFPEGIDNEGFFHKDLVDEHPSWVKTHTVFSKSAEKKVHYLLCQNPETLLFIANLGTVELHPWMSRIEHLNNPDYFVVDLDPHQVGFDRVIECALVIRELFEKLEIESYPKTSGFTGLHICIPLGAKYTYKQALEFGKILSTLINNKLPKLTSEVRNPELRHKKIYLDIYQNRKGQTIVAPYSLRPSKEATVSTPLLWSEVNSKLDPVNFTIKTVPLRLSRHGDLFKEILGKGIDIEKILKNIDKQGK